MPLYGLQKLLTDYLKRNCWLETIPKNHLIERSIGEAFDKFRNVSERFGNNYTSCKLLEALVVQAIKSLVVQSKQENREQTNLTSPYDVLQLKTASNWGKNSVCWCKLWILTRKSTRCRNSSRSARKEQRWRSSTAWDLKENENKNE